MLGPVRLDAASWYDSVALNELFGLKLGAIDRARYSGALRFTRRGGCILFRGDWVHQWLSGEPAPSRPDSLPAV